MRLLDIKKNFSRTEKKKTNIDKKASLRRKQTEKNRLLKLNLAYNTFKNFFIRFLTLLYPKAKENRD